MASTYQNKIASFRSYGTLALGAALHAPCARRGSKCKTRLGGPNVAYLDFPRGHLPSRTRILDKEEKSSAHPLFLTGKTLVFPPVCIPTWLFTPEVRTGTTHQGLRCMNRRHTNPQQDHIGPPSTDNRVQSFNSVMPIAPRAAPSIFPANQNLREQSP